MHLLIVKCFLLYLPFALENCHAFLSKPEEPILLADLMALSNKFKSHLDLRFNDADIAAKTPKNSQDTSQSQRSPQQSNGNVGVTMAQSNNSPVVSPSPVANHQQLQNYLPQDVMSPLMQHLYRMQSLHMEQQRQHQQMTQSNAMAMMMPMMYNQQVAQSTRSPYITQSSAQSPSFLYPSMMHPANQLDQLHHHHQQQQQQRQHQGITPLGDNFIFTPIPYADGDKAAPYTSLPIYVAL